MRRTGIKTWLTFALAVLIVGCALAWISAHLLRFDEEHRATEARESYRARLRLAVWRIDSLMAPVLGEEAARPPSHYRSFYPLIRSYDAKGKSQGKSQVLVPSPILRATNDWATLNFQLSREGAWTSPQVPESRFFKNAVENGVSLEEIDRQRDRLVRLESSVDGEELKSRLSSTLVSNEEDVADGWFIWNNPATAAQEWDQRLSQQELQTDADDFNARQRALNRYAGQQRASNQMQSAALLPSQVKVSRLVPMWLAEQAHASPLLVLARKVQAREEEYVQGVLVDWPRLKAMAEDEVKDLFPDATLRPREEGAVLEPERALAVLPAALDPGTPAEPMDEVLFTPVRVGLVLIWSAFLLGAFFSGMGLRSLLELNRRRLDFVSAVTHELRTPLTTFRMYTEMLKEGMVSGEKKDEYYATLNDESVRLSHLVQNVLDYSRLESRRGPSKLVRAALREHLDRILPTLKDRCNRKGVPFRLDAGAELDDAFHLDPSAVEQILLNLVDNACKYGEGEVRLGVKGRGGRIRFAVSDEGPGVKPSDGEKIFSPFFRGSTSEGKESGVGLGLALCRRWARELGGDLWVEKGEGGRFVLELGD